MSPQDPPAVPTSFQTALPLRPLSSAALYNTDKIGRPLAPRCRSFEPSRDLAPLFSLLLLCSCFSLRKILREEKSRCGEIDSRYPAHDSRIGSGVAWSGGFGISVDASKSCAHIAIAQAQGPRHALHCDHSLLTLTLGAWLYILLLMGTRFDPHE